MIIGSASAVLCENPPVPGFPDGATPHPSPLSRKLALASLRLWSVRIRKRMGEGVPSRLLKKRPLSLKERDRVRGSNRRSM
jgi:hypothetical protein